MAHSSWGSGYPNCDAGAIDSGFSVDGITFPGGVRGELCELVGMLVRECRNRGYQFGTDDDPSYGCWGYSCRAISGSNTPSNHSWGLAVDINAPWNPYTSPLVTDMPEWMPDLWNAYGFRWGGDYSGDMDAMHYEYMGSVSDAANDTARAAADGVGGGGSGSAPAPIPDDENEDETMQLAQASDGGNGALFAYSPGRFIHVEGPDHLRVGDMTGLWNSASVKFISAGELDLLRDNCCGNGAGKGDNMVTELPSSVAGF